MYLSTSVLNVILASLCLAPSTILATGRVTVAPPQDHDKHQLSIEGVQGTKRSLTFESTGNPAKPWLLVEADAGEKNSNWGAGAGEFDFGYTSGEGVDFTQCVIEGSPKDNVQSVIFPMIPQHEADTSSSFAPCTGNGITIKCQPVAVLCPDQ